MSKKINTESGTQEFMREVSAVLSELDHLDHLAVMWGVEGVFRRCRDRLLALLSACEQLPRVNSSAGEDAEEK